MTNQDVAGFYHETPGGIGSGYLRYFALYEDGRWLYGDEYKCDEDGAPIDRIVLRRIGSWDVDDNEVVLRQEAELVYEGGVCRCDGIGCEPEGGQEKVSKEEKAFRVDLEGPCKSPFADKAEGRRCLTIDGVGYFNLGSAEAYLPLSDRDLLARDLQ